MKSVSKFLAGAAFVAAAAVAASAVNVFDNPGFETGDTSGWDVSIPYYGGAGATGSLPSVGPVEGSYLGYVESGGFNSYNSLSQSVSLGKKDRISGYAVFTTFDYLPFNDDGQVYVLSGGSVVATALSSSVAAVGDGGSTGWIHWEYEAPAAGDYTVHAQVVNRLDGAVSSYVGLDALDFEKGIIEVTLDVKPGSADNPINLKSKGVTPVAILGTGDFDVRDVDVDSLAFGPNGVGEAHGKGHYEDVNGDGYEDLVLHFDTQSCGFAAGDTSVSITGQVGDGTPLEGSDVVSVQ